MSVLVGVDAGASHTEAVAGDESLRPVGRHHGAQGAMHRGDPAAVASVIGRVVSGALNEAGLSSKVDAIAVGAAGAGRERERAALEQALADRLGSETKLDGDDRRRHRSPGRIWRRAWDCPECWHRVYRLRA